MTVFLLKEKHAVIAAALLAVILLGWYTGMGRPQEKTPAGEIKHAHTSLELAGWWKSIELALQTKGVDVAFDIVSELYLAEPVFAKNCHGFVHKLGRAAYHEFRAYGILPSSPKISSCGYGFYHGFMEALTQTSRDLSVAREFCSEAQKRLALVLGDACFHGIGHGAVNMTESRAGNKAQALIDRALAICEKVARVETDYLRCSSGVFMEIAKYYTEEKGGLVLDRNDPLKVCREQKERDKNDCYTQMNGALNWLTKNNFTNGAKYVERISEDAYAQGTILALISTSVNLNKPDHTPEIFSCRSLSLRLRLHCIKGIALGFMLRWSPGNEHQRALQFCATPIMMAEEKMACQELVMKELRYRYTIEKFMEICESYTAGSARKLCSAG